MKINILISERRIAQYIDKHAKLLYYIDNNFDYYYLNTSDLMELGIKDVESSNEDGHYIVAYSMNSVYPNIVEVINTKGYLGNYTLSRIQAL